MLTRLSSVLVLPSKLSQSETSLTVHLNFYTLCAMAILAVITLYSLIRSKYFKNYSNLPEQSQSVGPKEQIDFYPDSRPGIAKPGLHNYLDEFLSAIKVFGYLERPVFHELTRHMQTRKLLAGETLNLEDEKSFCLVVDGHVQVFFKSNRDSDSAEEYEEGGENYKLLTDVRNGMCPAYTLC